MSCFDAAFHYKSYGTFCLHEKRLIISRVALLTTEIIEPHFSALALPFFALFHRLQLALGRSGPKRSNRNCTDKSKRRVRAF
ncbi:MAG: hypothetical protein DI617_07250 [Streptococcus pyogenes]|nr:MAG: hypothetical protein DI617_07250 [Streptococcus pyogenes]